jgi:short-subunit dehydrogenase
MAAGSLICSAASMGSTCQFAVATGALRNEPKDSGVTVTGVMPGPTDTEFFAHADMTDTKVAADAKDHPAVVAKDGFDAMQTGKADVVCGWKNKLQTTAANVMPNEMLAEQHRTMAEPGSAKKAKSQSRPT